MLKGILRKCRKHYLDWFQEFSNAKSTSVRDISVQRLRAFAATCFPGLPEKDDFDLTLGALIFNQEVLRGQLTPIVIEEGDP